MGRRCDLCGHFFRAGPLAQWQMIYAGWPTPCPDREIYRCDDCVKRVGSFTPQLGIRPEFSSGQIANPSAQQGNPR